MRVFWGERLSTLPVSRKGSGAEEEGIEPTDPSC